MKFRPAAFALAALAGVLLGAAPDGATGRETKPERPLTSSLHESPMPRIERQTLARLDPVERVPSAALPEVAQIATSLEQAIRQIEERGYSKVTGLMRRGQNYVFQATDPYGDRVRVVMNVQTGEIVGLSRIMPKKN